MLKKGAASFVTSGVVALARMTQHCKLKKVAIFSALRGHFCISAQHYTDVLILTILPPTHPPRPYKFHKRPVAAVYEKGIAARRIERVRG